MAARSVRETPRARPASATPTASANTAANLVSAGLLQQHSALARQSQHASGSSCRRQPLRTRHCSVKRRLRILIRTAKDPPQFTECLHLRDRLIAHLHTQPALHQRLQLHARQAVETQILAKPRLISRLARRLARDLCNHLQQHLLGFATTPPRTAAHAHAATCRRINLPVDVYGSAASGHRTNLRIC